jgi:processive 1,2-diacylglycerol beta-glucosyltransferase
MLSPKKVLLLYISILSGHHRAAMAIERALKIASPETQVYSINSFNYTNPILEKIINRTYMGIIRRTPEVWEYLYDNPKVVNNTRRLKEIIHRYNSLKMKALIDDFSPDVVACTQAFPCGMVADYKSSFNSRLSLFGVLTDFYPHSYWIYDSVDKYIVASEDARAKLMQNGVYSGKIHVFGIPIDPDFKKYPESKGLLERIGLEQDVKTILIMGGSGGLGPMKRIASVLDRLQAKSQFIVVTGTNSRLESYLKKRCKNMKKKVAVIGYSQNTSELMSVSDIIVTKPGGLTVSEALTKRLPIVIINPIPGQESKNTQFLLKNNVAIKVANEEELLILLDNLFSMPSKLESMRLAAKSLSKPDASRDIARLILES